ncbi:hypothetical protein RRG08_066664, partial [Elysia crispata]
CVKPSSYTCCPDPDSGSTVESTKTAESDAFPFKIRALLSPTGTYPHSALQTDYQAALLALRGFILTSHKLTLFANTLYGPSVVPSCRVSLQDISLKLHGLVWRRSLVQRLVWKISSSKACVEKISSSKACVEKISSSKACVEKISSSKACVEKISSSKACVEKISSSKACVEKISSSKLCGEDLEFKGLCGEDLEFKGLCGEDL